MTAAPGTIAERRAWIALASTPGVGDITFERLLAAFGSAAAALDAMTRRPRHGDDRYLAGRLGLRLARGLGANLQAAASDPGRTERRVAALGGWILTPLDATYPSRLADLEQPPPVLYGLGRPEVLEGAPMVAVVGTRRPTGQGRSLASRVATRLAQVGVSVVSGLAVGVDGIAHAATIESGGTTVAVAGAGLDAPAPRANRRLAAAIVESGGAIVSELAPDVTPSAGTFPRRNRIISVLASSTIVVEAPARSGALITARHALEQGRRLLVAPGRPLDPSVAGCNALLRETPALPLVGLDEMVDDLGLDRPSERASGQVPERPSLAAALESLSPAEREVAAHLMSGPQTIDTLVERTGRAPGEVAGAVTILQLRGWARAHGSVQLAAGALLGATTR